MNPTTLYAAIWKDRHADTTVTVFSVADTAIEWAKQQARRYVRREDDLDERLTQPMRLDGWLYYGCYSCEGDCIWVVEVQLDKEAPSNTVESHP